MDRPVELIPLVCIKCSTPIPAEPQEVAWVCSLCGQGMLLQEQQGLTGLQVNYAEGIPPGCNGRPFWVTEGSITLMRETYSGNKDREAQEFWKRPHTFFVPAFACNLESLLSLGTQLLLNPPAYQPGLPCPFEPVVLPLEDVQATADFIVMAIEAGRKDKLKKVDFSLQLANPSLWILP